MSQVIIENPIINSPYEEPTRHFRFGEEGITNEVVNERRSSSYFVPIARPKKSKSGPEQPRFDTEWTQDRIEENKIVNDIRRRRVSGSTATVAPSSRHRVRSAVPDESAVAQCVGPCAPGFLCRSPRAGARHEPAYGAELSGQPGAAAALRGSAS
jgi:hypothetical protein